MRLGIYARVSTEKQEKQKTIQSQLAPLRAFADDGGHTLVGEYVDDGYSGELLDRPDLDRLRDDVRKRLLDGIAVYCPDRLSRNFAHLCLLKDEFAKYGVKIIYLNRPDREDTPEEKLLENVEGVVAEYEKAKILERTRRGKLHKANRGFIVGGKAPYGYRYVPGDKNKREPGHYEVVKKEAEVVKLMFRLLVNDKVSMRGIVRELTRRGISPRHGKHWRTSTVHRILRNETYIGKTYYNKYMAVEPQDGNGGNGYRRRKNASLRLRPTGQWIRIKLPKSLRIIDKKTFERAQKQMEINAVQSPRNVRNQYLLRGMIECGLCESPFQGTPCHGTLYYRCGNRNRTFPEPKSCPVGSVRAEPLEDAVWGKIREAIENPELIASQIERLKKRASKGQGALRKQLEALEKGIAGLDDEENRVLDLYREKVISMEKVREQIAKVQDKRNRLDEERQSLMTELAKNPAPDLKADDVVHFCDLIGKRLKALSADFNGKRRILGLLVSKIVLEGKVVRIRGAIPAVGNQVGQDPCRIASMSSWCYGRRLPSPRPSARYSGSPPQE